MGLFTFLKKSEVFHVGETPVLNGLFGVPKKKEFLDDGREVLRMICNAIPTNACQVLLEGDIRALPYFVQWTGIQIGSTSSVWSQRGSQCRLWSGQSRANLLHDGEQSCIARKKSTPR